MFAHVRSDESLAPIGKYADEPGADKYNLLAGEQVSMAPEPLGILVAPLHTLGLSIAQQPEACIQMQRFYRKLTPLAL